MSASPIEFPTRTSSFPVLSLSESPLASGAVAPFAERMAARERHEVEFEVTTNIRSLPASPHTVTDDAVLVFATNIDVLAAWLYELNGTITLHDTGIGVTTWVLRTRTDVDPEAPGFPVLVSVSLPTGEQVMPEIAAAVVSS